MEYGNGTESHELYEPQTAFNLGEVGSSRDASPQILREPACNGGLDEESNTSQSMFIYLTVMVSDV